jgi:hypothetical protein
MPSMCYFCAERERVGYWSYWCEECAMLRRMLLINSPQKCIDILKRTLTRDDKQIDFKINQEIKKIVTKEIEKIGDDSHDESPKTRSKTK